MNKNYLNCKGLSLVEVVTSTLLITMVIVAFFGVYANAKNMIVLSFHKMTALYWAQSEIERLKNQVRGPVIGSVYLDETAGYPFNISSSAQITPATTPFNVLKDDKSGRIYYHVDANVTNVPNFKQATVYVTWTE